MSGGGGGICPGECPGGKCPGGYMSGGKCPGSTCPFFCCPVTTMVLMMVFNIHQFGFVVVVVNLSKCTGDVSAYICRLSVYITPICEVLSLYASNTSLSL